MPVGQNQNRFNNTQIEKNFKRNETKDQKTKNSTNGTKKALVFHYKNRKKIKLKTDTHFDLGLIRMNKRTTNKTKIIFLYRQ